MTSYYIILHLAETSSIRPKTSPAPSHASSTLRGWSPWMLVITCVSPDTMNVTTSGAMASFCGRKNGPFMRFASAAT